MSMKEAGEGGGREQMSGKMAMEERWWMNSGKLG